MSTDIYTPDTETQLTRFSPSDTAIAALAEEYLPLQIAGLKDVKGYAKVHHARMDCRSKRVAIEKLRKELKADALKFGRTVDGEAKRLTALLEPIETHLLGQEKVIDDEKERIRTEQLRKKVAETKAKADAEAAEAKRIADEEAARVKAEQDAEKERIRVDRKKLEAETKAAQDKLDAQARVVKAEQDHIAAEQKAARDKIEADRQAIKNETARLAAIEANRVQAKELEKAKAEAAEKAKNETEARIAREATEKVAREKAEAEAAEAGRLGAEALRPDKEKLSQVANAVASIEVPGVSPAATKAAIEVSQLLNDCFTSIRAIAEGMK